MLVAGEGGVGGGGGGGVPVVIDDKGKLERVREKNWMMLSR